MAESSVFAGRVLVVDDDPDMRILLETTLHSEGFRVTAVDSLGDMRDAVTKHNYDAVLLDLFLGDEDGLEGLPYLVQESPYSKVIIMTAYGSIELAVDAMKKGASGFLTKSTHPQEIIRELKSKINSERATGKHAVSPSDVGIVGESPALVHIIDHILRIKDIDSTVLITGESGTGKELIARAIHNLSNRSEQRFEAINCAAIPENLLESELFGHKRGAFTDAKVDRKGIFEICSDGTLLLDEIGEMPMQLQVKLLRVLQEREITPLGCSRSVKINTRVIAATNKNLEDLIKRNAFREDLFFRLSVIQLQLPTLRERKSDIPLLVNSFRERFNNRFNKHICPPSSDLLTRLMAHEWQGNIRELQNAVERGVVLSQDDELHLEDMLHPSPSSLREARAQLEDEAYLTMCLTDAKQRFEKAYLEKLLDATNGNISEMARLSGRYRADIYRLLSKHGVQWEEFRA